MYIRRAMDKDLNGINRLLRQVLEVHHSGRPDLFKGNAKKYSDKQLLNIISDDTRPIFAAIDEETERVMGYAFCAFIKHIDDSILTDILTLYIDDLCVDEDFRGQHIGSALYKYVLDFAKSAGCYNVTLNVWACNESAKAFYEKQGLVPQKIGMEKVI